MVGLGCNDRHRQDRARIGERNLKVPDQRGEHERRLCQSEGSADALAWTGAERQIGQPRRRLSVPEKSRWLKGVGVTPQRYMPVQHPRRYHHQRAARGT